MEEGLLIDSTYPWLCQVLQIHIIEHLTNQRGGGSSPPFESETETELARRHAMSKSCYVIAVYRLWAYAQDYIVLYCTVGFALFLCTSICTPLPMGVSPCPSND